MSGDPEDPRSALLSYATDVAAADDETTVYESMTDTAARVLAFDTSVVEVETDGYLEVRAWAGDEPGVDGIPVDEGLAGHTYRTGDPEIVSNVDDDSRAGATDHSSVLTVPVGDVGVFQAGRREPDAFDENDLELAELLASHAAQALERVRSQRELRESEARFRRLFEQSEDALVLYDTDGDEPGPVVYANDAAESLFGRPESDLREHSLGDLLDANVPSRLVPDDGAEFETRLDDGRVVNVTVQPFLRRDGPDAFAVLRDVSSRRRRERTLTRLHEATREMMAAESTNAVADLLVAAAERLFDLPYVGVFVADDDAGELRPASLSEALPTDEAPVLRAGESLAWDVYESDEPRVYENVHDQPNAHNPDTVVREEMIHPLGEYGVLLVGADERDAFDRADRDLLRVLATNSEAALDRAHRLRELQRREAELRRERNRFAALYENIPSPTASFVIDDGEPVARSVNPAFESVFGYSAEALVGENIDEYIVPPGRESEARDYNEKLQAGKNVNAEVRRLTTDGQRDFLLDVVPFRLDEPNVYGYAMYTDITDRRERERELERQNDRLEEFANIVSHDLRNPLNVASGYVELASETGDPEHFERAEDALERMHDIVESVLTLAREGRSLDETRDVSLADAATEAWRNVDTAVATLSTPADATLDADPSRLGSLLENLFRNAVEHGGSDVAVTVGCLDDRAGFFVEDDGPGIPPERRDDVFDSGETTTENGTGFGLAIVQSIADAHGWDVALTDGERGGARFEFAT